MQKFVTAFLGLDRRIIYLIVFLCVLLPLLFPPELPFTATREVRTAFDAVEDLPPGSVVLISCDFGASTIPENYTMYIALLHQCFRKQLRPVVMTLVDYGAALADKGLREVLHTTDASNGNVLYPGLQDGKDYAFLGFKPGSTSVMLGIGQSFTSTFPKDYSQKNTREMPIFREVTSLKDVSLIFDIAAVGLPEFWVPYASARENVPLAVSCTAVSAAQYYPYYQAGQFTGLVGGMKGAAEYELLVGMKEILGRTPDATRGMDAQTAVHVFIVLAIILANFMYFYDNRLRNARRQA
jgi:hypothetical protein